MDAVWKIITIIGSVVITTSTVLRIYYSHKRSLENRIKDIESKVQNHEKFVQILEKRALSALEEEFNGSSKTKNKNGK
jgi:hypothetical protein